ncbi:asparagine synthase (glutamine-hydrolyzing) [Catalinimonas niigatensis]|uniref:asparagine synthase (glutamine-hydrolyzing) n=1 Tax=Catalinimonas niigatensis TaxID=1397264 RepID=UPI002666DAB0|nr:asparagine synthase (glutamine-hydrolyzing) [Catalinimonas niigatensis]WPP50624.1 asparagine synthase (glutamine-hydrolyzing) [Catalinimonas niigatensis]
MCGIHLIFDKNQQLTPEQPSAITQMLQSSRERGPDAQGVKALPMLGGSLHLGSNRLQIIDPHTRANQPMSSADGRYWLCFNGTIYNYFELRNKLLSQGVQFTTQSDTEVLLYMLITKGAEALEDLNGMFALLFYDQKEQKLLAARDRFGMKPLYYADQNDFLIFSSEAKGIIASGLLEKKLHEAAIQDYLCLRYVRPPYTFFEQVYQLPPGHCMEIKDQKKAVIRSFAKPPERIEAPSEEAALTKTEELLKDAVLNHLVGDANCGLFLSGGVDSTLLLSLIKEMGAHPVPTFSIINNRKEGAYGTEDYRFAGKAAAMYGSHHYELDLESSMLHQYHEAFMSQIDQPVGDSAAFMTYMLSAEVKKIAGVALNGAGADEIFAGYNRHQAFHRYLSHYDAFIRFSSLLKTGSSWLPTGFSHPLRKKFRLLKKLGQSLDKDPGQTFINFISDAAFSTSCHQRLAIKSGTTDQTEFVEKWLYAALEHELQNYLPADVLSLSDTMSMARSLEMRMPYLDLPLATYLRSLPAEFRMKHGKKWMLRSLLEARGGKIFTQRSKEGFGLPFGQWLRSGEAAYIRQTLQQKEQLIYQYVSHEQILKLLQEHHQKRADHSQSLWSIWVLANWLQLHFS